MSGRSERVFLSLGGNIGEPAKAFAAALRLLDADPETKVVQVSSLYRTPPWGKTDQPDFLNAAAELETSLDPQPFLQLCLQSECALKRVRAERWGPRIVDLDVLVFGNRDIHEPGLQVPHPHLFDRAFVLVPLAEIAPDLVVQGRVIAEAVKGIDHGGIVKLGLKSGWWKDGRQ